VRQRLAGRNIENTKVQSRSGIDIGASGVAGTRLTASPVHGAQSGQNRSFRDFAMRFKR